MKKIHNYLIVLLLVFVVNGCKKLEDFGDTNLDPSASTQPVLSALLTNVESGLGALATQTRPGLYGQYFSETQYTDASLYSIPQLPFDANYSGPLNDLQIIINKNESNNMNMVASILQQYIFWAVTDRWGDVPYSEALKAVEIPNPKYDTQEEIYKGMIAALTTAVNGFDGTSVIKGDVIFAGDVDSWKRAANSMRMLMALQLSKRYPNAGEYAANEFNAALTHPAGYISTNEQNMTIDYPGGNFKSPWWRLYDGRKDYAESETMTNLMSSLSDTRQNAFGGKSEVQTSADAEITSNVGMPYGVKRETAVAFTDAHTDWARILRGDFRKEDGDVIVISAAEIALARAEARNYGWTNEDLTIVYEAGITLSFEQWDEDIPAGYTAQGAVALAAAGDAANLEKIATQRYIATYPDGLKSWNIWRKTGFPILVPAPDATNTTKQIPRRYTYASSEYSTNEAKVKEAVARLATGLDTQDERVWWDKL
ncbi:MAG: hypothetical protein RLZ47_764 [Bacteroidota bacterium]|jgi:hypothetical protein